LFLEAADLLLKKMDVEIHVAGSGDLTPLAIKFVEAHKDVAYFTGS